MMETTTQPGTDAQSGKRARGATVYRAEYADIAEAAAAEMGATDANLARVFKVTPRAILQWKKKHPAFAEALARGKEEADAKVVKCLYQRATGYTYTEKAVVTFPDGGQQVTEHEKHAPPNVDAQVKWLYNRQPKRWRPQPLENQDEDTLPSVVITYEEDKA
ncbi:MAG: hypothetical protein LBC59_09610 [Chitinispirillales bacterium]|jgi:hypothetical protein|nr:hypothetical protein [Chitinispirillales bacterium]